MDELDKLIMTKDEEEYFDLLFNKNLDVENAIKVLREKGKAATRTELVKFKQAALQSLINQQRDEHMSELILTSFDRTKIEFNDLMERTKELLEDAPNGRQRLEAIKELRAQLETALTQQNKTAEQLITLINERKKDDQAKLQVFEQMKLERERWFDQMDATVTEDKKVVFNNPTPEFIDSLIRFRFQKQLKEGKVVLDV